MDEYVGRKRRNLEGRRFYGRQKTAAVLKLQCSATVPQGCVFVFGVCMYLCEENGDRGQHRAEMEREGRDRQDDLVIFFLLRC